MSLRRVACILLSVSLLAATEATAQVKYYESVFRGGVVTGGYSVGATVPSGSGSFNVNIPGGSTIRRALLIGARIGNAPALTVTLNGAPYTFNASNVVTSGWNTIYGGNSGIHVIDVTAGISAATTAYTIATPTQSTVSDKYPEFYLYIAFDNPALIAVHSAVYLTNMTQSSSMVWTLTTATPIRTADPVGLAVLGGYATGGIDNENVNVNGTAVGAFGGQDFNGTSMWGSMAGFQYHSRVLTGYNDDNANQAISGTDVLSDIKALVPNGTTSFPVTFTHAGGGSDNHVFALFLTSTPSLGVLSISRASASPTVPGSIVAYTVTFNSSVSGVDVSDFALTTTGVSGASIVGVAGTGATRTVTVNTGTGTGTVRLDVVDDDTILDTNDSQPLGGTGAGNGSYSAGEVYTLSPTATGGFVISEFRLSGPAGSADEFVEVHNTGTSSHVVTSSDASAGYGIATADGTVRAFIPNGTVIPATGHWLGANSTGGTGYSLSSYPAGAGTATHDGSWTTDIPPDTGLALFNTANPAALSLATRLDAVGFTSSPALYREGTGLPLIGASAAEHAWRRRQESDFPQDTNVNLADFVLVSTTGGSIGGTTAVLGAPSPETRTGDLSRATAFTHSDLDDAVPETATPNRLRNATPVANGNLGILEMRRRFVNTTGTTVSRLRFRVIDVTTSGSPVQFAPQADLRALDAPPLANVTTIQNGLVATVLGTTVEDATPLQPGGGGLGSSLLVNLGSAVPPGGVFYVNFRVGVMAKGSFEYWVMWEAATP